MSDSPEFRSTKERPVFVPASRPKKLPYLCAAAECVTCKATVSGDWGLVPDECEACDARRRELYYRALVQWAEAENGRLTAEVAELRRALQEIGGYAIGGNDGTGTDERWRMHDINFVECVRIARAALGEQP